MKSIPLHELRKMTKGDVRKRKGNQNELAPIRHHASREITLHYGKSLTTMRKDKTVCPICEKLNWVIDIIHLKDIADYPDDAFLGEINHLWAQLLGCGHCHAKFDWGTKQSPQNFNSYPAPMKIDWCKHRIKVFEVAKEARKNLEYNDLGYKAFKPPIDFDEEIKNLEEKIRHIQTTNWYNWTPKSLKLEVESPKRWYRNKPRKKTIIQHRSRPISYYTGKLVLENGTKRLGAKKYDRIRPIARMEYRYADIPYKCIKCGCTHSLEIVHIKDIGQYPDTATMLEINNTNVTASLCKGCHRMLDGNKDIKQSDDFKIWMEEFKVVHDKFKSEYKFKYLNGTVI